MKMLDYYRLIRNSVQLQDVKLKSVKCEILDENSKRRNLSLSIERDVKASF